MRQTYRARKTKIGNSKGLRLPKALVLSPGQKDVILEQTKEGILINPAHVIPPLKQWEDIFAKAGTMLEPELNEWDITLQDGLEDR